MRRGVIDINDVAAVGALIIIVILFLGLFLLEKDRMSGAAGESGIEVDLTGRHASLALNSYLQSPFGSERMSDAIQACIGDCPYNASTINFFSRFCKSSVLQIEKSGVQVRLGDGIRNELTVAGANYEEWFLNPGAKFGSLPPFERRFLNNPRASFLKAQQHLPNGITVTLLCIESDGVILS